MRWLILLPFVIFPLVIVIVLGIKGYKRGWRYGVGGVCSVVAASVLAIAGALGTSRLIYGSGFIETLKSYIDDRLYPLGVGAYVWEDFFRFTFDRVAVLVLAPLFLVIFYLLARVVCKFVIRNAPEIPPRSKYIGLGLAFASAIIAGVFSFGASGVNIWRESARISHVINVAAPLVQDNPDMETLAHYAPELLDIYFDTTLIAATEAARAELLADIVNVAVSDAFPGINTMLIRRPSRDNFIKDAGYLSGLVPLLDLDDFENFEDYEALSRYIFRFSFSVELGRAVLTMIIRDVSGDDTFIYPPGILTRESEAEFAHVMGTLIRLWDSITLADVHALRDSYLFPAPVFRYLTDIVEGGQS